MRAVLLGFAVWCCAGQPVRSEPVYYLIDNSGSMAGLRESVDAEIESLVSEGGAASQVSVTYFQGSEADDCSSSVTLTPATIPILPFDLNPPSARGSTLIVKAIEAARQIPSNEAASVRLYTDGSYADSVCETAESICAALTALQVDRPLLDFSFQYPPAVRAAGSAVLLCPGSNLAADAIATNQASKISDQSNAVNETESAEGGTKATCTTEQGSALHVPTIVSWAAIPWLIVALLGMNTLARRRFTKAIEESDGMEDPTSKPGLVEKWTVRLLNAALIGAVLCLIFFAFDGPKTWLSLVWVYEEANRPLLAIVFAWALTVVSGWYFVERMKDMQARQSKAWRLNHASALQRNEEREIGRIKELLTSRLSEHQNLESVSILRQRTLIADDDWTRVEAISAKAEAVRTWLSELVAEVNAFAVLERHQSATYANVKSITRFLVADEKVDSEMADQVNAFFETWKSFLRKLPTVDAKLESEILAFQIEDVPGASKV